MKYFNLIIISICLLLGSCGKDEPKSNVVINIYDSFIPASIVVNRSDSALIEECKKVIDKKLIINSKEDLPEDPFNTAETFSNIGFTNQTLLVYYNVHSYDILSYSNQYIRNNVENTYDWTITLGINGDSVDSFDQLIVTRYAILVPKLPKKADLKVWLGIRSYQWDWD